MAAMLLAAELQRCGLTCSWGTLQALMNRADLRHAFNARCDELARRGEAAPARLRTRR
jgi:hypothetical protein